MERIKFQNIKFVSSEAETKISLPFICIIEHTKRSLPDIVAIKEYGEYFLYILIVVSYEHDAILLFEIGITFHTESVCSDKVASTEKNILLIFHIIISPSIEHDIILHLSNCDIYTGL